MAVRACVRWLARLFTPVKLPRRRSPFPPSLAVQFSSSVVRSFETYGFALVFGSHTGGAGTTAPFPSARQRRRSCETRLRRKVTAEGDMSTFIVHLLRGA